MKTIEILISPRGEVSLQTKGFAGSACRDASRFLEQALGRQATEQFTAEFFARAETEQQAQQRS